MYMLCFPIVYVLLAKQESWFLIDRFIIIGY